MTIQTIMEKKYKLDLIGITYNQIESGVYAVILQQSGGSRRIPIIIGYPEAQAIECKLQNVITPRPLTHDMMVNMMYEFGICLVRVEIRKLPNGVFAADLIFSDGKNLHKVDSRSSDAIALAIRVDAPIYTTADVLEEAGFDPVENSESKDLKTEKEETGDSTASIKKTDTSDKDSQTDIETLKSQMQEAAENEDYEEAARLREIIRRLQK